MIGKKHSEKDQEIEPENPGEKTEVIEILTIGMYNKSINMVKSHRLETKK